MRKIVLFLLLFCFISTRQAYAIEDPNAHSNNKVGVHILFPSELPGAATLINSSGGDWGYVTIPIQAGDRDMVKWQKFFDDCATYHVIPIVRLSSEIDYFRTTSWRKPNYLDISDFANFLNSLNWPTKNRYIVVFNEPNRGDEWGGFPNAAEYADLLSYAVSVFKSKSPDFFVISAGLDNASINTTIAVDEFNYMRQMNEEIPGIFSQIDGIGSHSYPNPAFSSSPVKQDGESIASYRYEEAIAKNLSGKDLPVFITETGWSNQILSDSTIASYYQTAFTTVWNDSQVVAVTPFVLKAGGGPFTQFSFLSDANSPTKAYTAIKNLPKVKGQPTITYHKVLGVTTIDGTLLPEKDYQKTLDNQSYTFSVPKRVKESVKWLLKL